jgi:hypothetical protein
VRLASSFEIGRDFLSRPSQGVGPESMVECRSPFTSSTRTYAVSGEIFRLLSGSTAGSRKLGLADESDITARNAVLLILDGVLELEDDGGYRSGPPACKLFSDLDAIAVGESLTAQLSATALRLASTLPSLNVQHVADWLYLFNREPRVPAWCRRLPNSSAVESYLKTWVVSDFWSLRSVWQRSRPSPGFVYWRRREPSRMGHKRAPYKLYIAPRIAEMEGVVEFVAKILSSSDALAFKVGMSLDDLLRPDKIVVYLSSASQVKALAKQIGNSLPFTCGVGVPFTASLDSSGCLSWGKDRALYGMPENVSWRRWICQELAIALVIAKAFGSQEQTPWGFALRRISLESVDPVLWAPTEGDNDQRASDA